MIVECNGLVEFFQRLFFVSLLQISRAQRIMRGNKVGIDWQWN